MTVVLKVAKKELDNALYIQHYNEHLIINRQKLQKDPRWMDTDGCNFNELFIKQSERDIEKIKPEVEFWTAAVRDLETEFEKLKIPSFNG